MGIFTLLKKIFTGTEKTEPTREKISFSGIEDFIKKKTDETNAKENKAIFLIKQKITTFISELKEKIKLANEVDIESKEKNDKIKSAVYEGRRKYIEFLERFIENIENPETIDKKGKTNLEEIIGHINSAFLRFNESSKMSYERATILIGKEMGSIKELIKKFSKEMIMIFEENKDITLTSKKISTIKSKDNEIREIKEKLIKIDREITNINHKILEKEKESKEISENINKIKNSSEYLENIEKEKDIQIKEKEMEKQLSNLRQLLDFKALSNFFHIFEGQMEIVKSYRKDFLTEFKKDMGKTLLNLLDESKLNNEKISDKMREIWEKEEKIINSRKEIKQDETQALLSELEKISEEIKDLTDEKKLGEKKKEKLKNIKEEVLKLIKEELEGMNVEFEVDEM